MKAKLKVTRTIIDVKPCEPVNLNGLLYPSYIDKYGYKYPYTSFDWVKEEKEVDKMMEREKEASYIPTYWEKLKHQYAGMAMQALLNREIIDTFENVSNLSTLYATALVEKLKNE